MKIAVCTLFRNNAKDALHTFKQRMEWKQQVGYKYDIIHVCLEGDSIDDTYETIQSFQDRLNIILIKHDTGGPHYPSHAIPDRLITLGKLSNIVLERAMEENPSYILWLDSDVTIPKNYINRLLSHNKDVVAPMFFFENSTYFRDTWGYRVNNELFTNRYPYCKTYRNNELFEVDSVGLPLISAKVIKDGARFGDEEIVDLCRSIRALGYKIFVDPSISVTHPRNGTAVPKEYENA